MGILPFILRPKKDRRAVPRPAKVTEGGMTINITPDPERIVRYIEEQLKDDPTTRQRLLDWLKRRT
jgi:hypothetical protein